MLDPGALTVFLLATLALLVVPGPAVLYIVATSIDQGRKAGIVSTLGISLGTLFHVLAAALGLSALLMASATAFTVVKYLGALYLIFLGIQKLRQRPDTWPRTGPSEPSLRRAFWRGVVVNVLNPKTAVFFLAFLPQFVNPELGRVTLQIVLLGCIMVGMGVISDGAYALLAGSLGNWLRRSPRFLRAQHYVSGGTYLALGIAAAVAGPSRK